MAKKAGGRAKISSPESAQRNIESEKEENRTEKELRAVETFEELQTLIPSLIQEQRYSDAVKFCDRALEIFPNNPFLLFEKGRALLGLGKRTKGTFFLNKAARLETGYKLEAARILGETKSCPSCGTDVPKDTAVCTCGWEFASGAAKDFEKDWTTAMLEKAKEQKGYRLKRKLELRQREMERAAKDIGELREWLRTLSKREKKIGLSAIERAIEMREKELAEIKEKLTEHPHEVSDIMKKLSSKLEELGSLQNLKSWFAGGRKGEIEEEKPETLESKMKKIIDTALQKQQLVISLASLEKKFSIRAQATVKLWSQLLEAQAIEKVKEPEITEKISPRELLRKKLEARRREIEEISHDLKTLKNWLSTLPKRELKFGAEAIIRGLEHKERELAELKEKIVAEPTPELFTKLSEHLKEVQGIQDLKNWLATGRKEAPPEPKEPEPIELRLETALSTAIEKRTLVEALAALEKKYQIPGTATSRLWTKVLQPEPTPSISEERKRAAIYGLINGIGRIRGMVNGTGRINGLVNGRRRFKGAVDARGRFFGLVNGLYTLSGYINGRGRVNGLYQGTRVSGIIEHYPPPDSLGRINGLVNGRVNGLWGFADFRDRKFIPRHRAYLWQGLLTGIILTVLVLASFVLYISPELTHAIAIDGNFEDWKETTRVYQKANHELNPNIDITNCSMDTNYNTLSFYVRVRGTVLLGNRHNMTDAIRLFVDTDLKPSTGYKIKGLGADYMLEVIGLNSSVRSSRILTYSPSRANPQYGIEWNWSLLAAVAAATDGAEQLEVQVSGHSLGWKKIPYVAVIVHAQDYAGAEDFADSVLTNAHSVLTVVQQSTADMLITVRRAKMLELEFRAYGDDIMVRSFKLTLTGNVKNGVLTLYENITPCAVAHATDGQAEFVLPTPLKIASNSALRFHIVADIYALPNQKTLGVKIACAADISSDADYTQIMTKSPASGHAEVGYIRAVPSEPVIDGAFADWNKHLDLDEQRDVENANIDITRYGVYANSSYLSFYLKVDGEMFSGCAVPVGSELIMPSRAEEPKDVDSDQDSVPDKYDLFPLDFDNDGVPDELEEHDIDSDGIRDYPYGTDYWLNTTIPHDFPRPYAGKFVSIYIGPQEEKAASVPIGVDFAYIFIDADNDANTGFRLRAGRDTIGADYMVNITGKNGKVLTKRLEQFDAHARDGTWAWHTIVNSTISTATDSTQLEAEVKLSSLGFSGELKVYFKTSDWRNTEDSSDEVIERKVFLEEVDEFEPDEDLRTERTETTGSTAFESVELQPCHSQPYAEPEFPAVAAVATEGMSQYRVKIKGKVHQTSLYFQHSNDGGLSWSEEAKITSGQHIPIDVKLVINNGILHLLWEDGRYRIFCTYYMQSRDCGATWSEPVRIEGDRAKIAVNGDEIFIVTRGWNVTTLRSVPFVAMSLDNGQTFTHTELNTAISCFRPDIFVDDENIYVIWSGGVCDELTSAHHDVGLYFMRSADGGKNWDNAKKLIVTKEPVRSLSIKEHESETWVEWIEESKTEFITYSSILNCKVWELESVETVTIYKKPEGISKGVSQLVFSPPHPKPHVDPNSWTWMIYMDGDNNLDTAAKADVNEAEEVGSNGDVGIPGTFNVLILYDYSANGDTKLYYCKQDSDTATITSPTIPLSNVNSSWSNEVNMGDPNSIIDFVKYCIKNYPAGHYFLDLWNHGGAFIGGMGDDTSDDSLNLHEWRYALQTIRKNVGFALEYVGWDACLMGNDAVHYEGKAFMNYTMGSEETEPGDGWEYQDVLAKCKNNLGMPVEQMGYYIVEAYKTRYSSDTQVTMAAINMTKFDYWLMPAFNAFAQKLKHRASTFNAAIDTARTNAQKYTYAYCKDLYDFAVKIQAQITNADDVEIYNSAEWVKQNITNSTWSGCVMYEWHSTVALSTVKNSYGITCYVEAPANEYAPWDSKEIAKETQWDEFHHAYRDNKNYPNEEPNCKITFPSDNSKVPHAIVIIEGTANDSADGGSVKKVQVKIDREKWVDATDTSSDGSWSTWKYEWNATSFAKGVHNITARAYDGTDFSEKYHMIRVTIPANNDLGIEAIDLPKSQLKDSQATITATVKNYGLNDQTNSFNVRCVIKDPQNIEVYNNSQAISSLASMATISKTWQYTPTEYGRYTVSVQTELTGDEYKRNNVSIAYMMVPLMMNNLATMFGGNDNDLLGFSVSTAGDVDGDGDMDLIVGAPYNDSADGSIQDCGAVYVFFAPMRGNFDPANADVRIYGAWKNAHFGWAVANAGNVNGTYDDIIVGMPDSTNGNVYIIYGWDIKKQATGDGVIIVSDTDLAAITNITGEAPGDKFGFSVSGAGNINNANYDDFVVGAYGYGTDRGRAYVFYGDGSIPTTAENADKILTGEADNDKFGFSVSGAGNVNNDGYADIIVGAPGAHGTGRAYIFYGSSLVSGYGNTNFISENFNDLFPPAGWCEFTGQYGTEWKMSATANAKGKAPEAHLKYGSSGIISTWRLYAGPIDTTNLTSITLEWKQFIDDYGTGATCKVETSSNGLTWHDTTWTWNSGGGNLGPEKRTLIIQTEDVGSETFYFSFTLTGNSYQIDHWWIDDVYLNGTRWADVILLGENAGDEFGRAVNSTGNVNKDNYIDIIVGAPSWSSSRGRAYVFYGSNSLPPIIKAGRANVLLDGSKPGDKFGWSVSCAGDIGNDGYDDILVGAPFNDTADGSKPDAGSISVFNGSAKLTGKLDAGNCTKYGAWANDNFGWCVSNAFDVNNDNYDDFIVGSPYNDTCATNNGKSYILTTQCTLSIVINEIATYGSGNDEWIELYNPSPIPIDVSGWNITDNDADYYKFPTTGWINSKLSPGKYLVIKNGAGTNDLDLSDGGTLYIGKTDYWASDNDDIVLKNEKNMPIDYIAYAATATGNIGSVPEGLSWIRNGDGYSGHAKAPGSGQSLSLIPNGVDNDRASDWYLGANPPTASAPALVTEGAKNVIPEFPSFALPFLLGCVVVIIKFVRSRKRRKLATQKPTCPTPRFAFKS